MALKVRDGGRAGAGVATKKRRGKSARAAVPLLANNLEFSAAPGFSWNHAVGGPPPSRRLTAWPVREAIHWQPFLTPVQ